MDSTVTNPFLHLPVLIDAAGTASASFAANAIRGFAVEPVDVTATLQVTVGPNSITLPAGVGWNANSPNGYPFANAVTVTATVGQFLVTKYQ